jgi:hypothetical protein
MTMKKREKTGAKRAGGKKTVGRKKRARGVTKSAKPGKRPARKSPTRPKPSRPAARATRGFMMERALVAVAATTVRDRVIAIFADVTGHSDDEVDGPALTDLVANCDPSVRARIAAEVNADWSNLNHTYSSSDVACSDTVDTLTNKVSGDLV